MRIEAWVLLLAHAVAAVFGLAGIVIALRHPELWAGTGTGEWLFSFGMRHGAVLQIALGAAAVLAFGIATLGVRRTAIFFVAATTLSLAAELVGTGTGWPFGSYTYGDALGPKVLERVPIAIPLSWFSLGLTSYLLARIVLDRLGRPTTGPAALVLGVWIFVVWDLALDPAMAHPGMPLRFWVWHQTGPYFGMPLQNLAGWTATAAAFMTVSRLAWGSEVPITRVPAGFPLAMYAVNVAFAMVLNASVGLWVPIVLAGALGLLPVAWLHRPMPRLAPPHPAPWPQR
jgi:putative membrane protein